MGAATWLTEPCPRIPLPPPPSHYEYISLFGLHSTTNTVDTSGAHASEIEAERAIAEREKDGEKGREEREDGWTDRGREMVETAVGWSTTTTGAGGGRGGGRGRRVRALRSVRAGKPKT